MIERKRICLITPSLEKGGMERVLVELANYGVSNGIDVYILAILPNRPIAYTMDTRVTYITPSYLYSDTLIFKWKSLSFLNREITKIRPHACLSFSETFNPLAILACKFIGIPVFISDRSNPTKPVGFLKKVVKKILYPMAAGMIAQTKFAETIFRKRRLNKRIITIPNPLREVGGSSNVRRDLNEKRVIISVGRLIPSKNFSQLIQFFSKTDYSGWELWILGEGRERTNLEGLINRLKLTGHVKLLGQVDNVDDYLAQGSIFAFTSLSEGFPNALSEAMAIPLACIAFDCPAGPSDIISDGNNGYLVPIGEEVEYISKLNELMFKEELRNKFSRQAYNNRKRFSKEETSEKYYRYILNF